MVNTKVILLILTLCVVAAAVAGIAFAQYASAQANGSRGVEGQLPQGCYTGYPQVPQQGYYPNGAAQYGSSYGYGYGGMGMCGRFW